MPVNNVEHEWLEKVRVVYEADDQFDGIVSFAHHKILTCGGLLSKEVG